MKAKSTQKSVPLPQAISRTVPLHQLRAGDAINARRTGRDAALDELKASILVHGVVQSLRVRLADDNTHYQVIAGNRRLLALQALLDEGKIEHDYEVPVIAGVIDDAAAHELSIVENIERVPVSPIDEIKAFGRLQADGIDAKSIGLRFGVPAKRVQQRLKLANLHPKLMDLLEQGKINIDTAQAFTVADPDRQIEVFETLSGAAGQSVYAWQVRSALTEKFVRADSELAKLVGKQAYLDAGGEIVSDLFEEATYWTSPDVVSKLVDAKWAEQISGWLGEGWGWVKQSSEVSNYYDRERLYKENDTYPAERLSAFGVVYWPTNGRVEFGIGEPRQKSAPARAASLPPDNPGAVGPTMSQVLSDVLSDALRTEIAADADLALPLLAAFMAAGQGGRTLPAHMSVGHAASISRDGGKSVSDAYLYFNSLPDEELLSAIARMFANTIDVGDTFLTSTKYVSATSRPGLVAELVGIVQPRDFPEFDAIAYFEGVKKPLIAAAFKEITGETIKDGKKAEMAATTAKLAMQHGWLPVALRNATYEGPGAHQAEQLEAAE